MAIKRLGQLGPLIADNPVERNNLAILKESATKRLDAADALIAESSRHLSRTSRIAKMQKGFHAMMEIRNTIANMENEERELLKSRLSSEKRHTRKLIFSISIESLLAVLFLSFSLWIISRQIKFNQRIQKEKERLENEIISMMTHELRNPLTVIYSALTVLSDHFLKNPSSEQGHILDIATKSSRRMQRLIEDFLEIQKLEYGAITFNIQVVELSSLIREVLESNQIYANQREVKLTLVEDLPKSFVKVDSERLAQVLSNLISNAVKHSPSNALVEVGILRYGSMLRVRVKDHGPGIPDVFRTTIFQKFSRAANEIYQNGNGLGLSISKAIIEKMGGTIQLGEDQNGATFYFDLPEVPS